MRRGDDVQPAAHGVRDAGHQGPEGYPERENQMGSALMGSLRVSCFSTEGLSGYSR